MPTNGISLLIVITNNIAVKISSVSHIQTETRQEVN